MIMPRRLAAMAIVALVCASPALAQEKLPPLRTGVDGTFAPHAMPKLGGGVEGFNVDLINAIGAKMGRKVEIFAGQFSGLIPAMNSGQLSFVGAPTTVTPERAQNLLFTEGYLNTYYSFVVPLKSADVKTFEDLKGKNLGLVDPNSTSGYNMPLYTLDKLGISPDTFFAKTQVTGSHGNAVLALAQGTVEVAANWWNADDDSNLTRMLTKGMLKNPDGSPMKKEISASS